MKPYVVIALLLLLGSYSPVFASGSVLVYPTVTNAHGGTKFANDLSTRIDYEFGSFTQSGVPTYSVTGSYTVTPILVSGYSASLRGDCNTTIADGESKTCYVDWQDGAPIIEPAPVVEAPPTYIPPAVGAEVPTEPKIIYVPVYVQPVVHTTDEEDKAKTLENIRLFEAGPIKQWKEEQEASTTLDATTTPPETSQTMIDRIVESVNRLLLALTSWFSFR